VIVICWKELPEPKPRSNSCDGSFFGLAGGLPEGCNTWDTWQICLTRAPDFPYCPNPVNCGWMMLQLYGHAWAINPPTPAVVPF
jgi:hypothetical protein